MRPTSFAGAALSAALLVLALPVPAHAAAGTFSVQPLGNLGSGGPAVEDPQPGTCYDMAPGEFATATNDTDAVAHTFPAAGCRGGATDIAAGAVGGLGIYGSVRFDS
ncbi:hypothetical protein [Embleya sp. NPDC005971]|uniref:hypothetical protein n=1 Tax=Embleya sp. NPDC005971 TaxID=3156724 RepID=UPI00340E891E